MITHADQDIHKKNPPFWKTMVTLFRKSLRPLLLLSLLLLIPSAIHSPHSLSPVRKILGPFPLPSLEDATDLSVKTKEYFPIPEALESQVGFWKKIFTEYTTAQIVIHDDWYLDVVYEVVDINEKNSSTGKSGWDAVKAAQEKYKKILEKLSEQWENPQNLTPEEERIWMLFKGITESHRFKKRDAKDRVHLQMGQADTFKTGIIRSGAYLDTMKAIFETHELPADLVYLPMIESAFNPLAISYVGAAGMWQFMSRTGKRYHLTINHMVDERRDPLLATQAAARMLKHNYDVLKSWTLAITAYNHGLQGMRNAIKQVKSEDIETIIAQYESRSFGFASRNFYAEFVTAIEIFKEYTKYYGDIDISEPLTLAQVRLPDAVEAEALERYCQIPISEIRELNPALHPSLFMSDGILPRNYPLNMLPEHKAQLLSLYAQIPDEQKYRDPPVPLRHRVRKNQTLSEIAKMYDTSVKKLMHLNRLKNSEHIRRGEILEIPGKYVSVKHNTSSSEEKRASGSERLVKHRVKKGETLSEIARKYNSTVHIFRELNHIQNPQNIRAGQMLRIPEG